MKPLNIKLSVFLLGATLLSACSGMKMASDELLQDDVYNTPIQAKEYAAYYQEKPKDKYAVDSAIYQEYLAELPFDPSEINYANRINRFSYYNPWRAYYDGMYGYMPSHYLYDYSYNAYLSGRNYGYFPYFNSRFGFNLGYTQFYGWFSPFSYWHQAYMPFNSWNYWGPISMFDFYHIHPIYGNGMWGPYWNSPWNGPFNGFWGGLTGGIIRDPYQNPNYGSRPVRGSENGLISTPRASAGVPRNENTRPSTMSGSRAERYVPQSGAAANRGGSTPTSSARPTRGTVSPTPTRPTMSNPPSTPTRSNTPPPASSGNSGNSGGGSRGESSGAGRPTRGN